MDINTDEKTDTNGPHPSLLKRKIIHVDMDAFYASVEIRDNPALTGKPVVIGGSPQSRSVVSTASYPARKFGIRSAMSCAMAARLCPEAIFLPPNFDKYVAVSHAIREIFSRYSPLVEPLSLDEAFIDVTDNSRGLFAVQIAREIKNAIRDELHLTASAGVGPNKLVAKIASDIQKPDGITVVLPVNVSAFMAPLPLRKIPGVGPVTEKDLASKGFSICRDIWPYTIDTLEERLGNRAEWLAAASRGLDESPVETEWVRKSLGEEETFEKDIVTSADAFEALKAIADQVGKGLKRLELRGRTVQLKVKYHDFKTITRRTTVEQSVSKAEDLYDIIRSLVPATQIGERPVRLLGIAVSNFD